MKSLRRSDRWKSYLQWKANTRLFQPHLCTHMNDNHWLWSFDSRIPSEVREGKQLITELLTQLAGLNWPDCEVFGIHLAVEEAIVNAIKHGNQDDPTKFVEVSIKLSKDRMSIQVTDQGNGFNPADVPDPTADENLELPSGRGLMLMRSFMSHVEYNDCGNSVTMARVRNAS